MGKEFNRVNWATATNIYEVNLRQYTYEGSFNAFKKELPRLHEMGVETLWFMPITPIGIVNRKGTLGSYYSVRNYVEVNEEFGTLNDFKELVNAAHAIGQKVIIDWVANHTSWDHVWTHLHPEFYSRDHDGNFRPPFPNWEDVIHLNFHNNALHEAMIDAMAFWVKECNIDGFRCDMAHLVPLSFWYNARKALDKLKPLFWMAECEEPEYHQVFDATYTWKWMHATQEYCRHKISIKKLFSTLVEYNLEFPKDAIRVYFTSNHDENSWNGSEYEKYQNAVGVLGVFACTWDGVPMLYSGQEMPNKKRLKFFDKDSIEWTGNFELHEFYKTLLNLHKNHPAVRGGDVKVATYKLHTSHDHNVFAYLRKREEKEIIVILNLSAEPINHLIIHEAIIEGNYRNVFANSTVQLNSHSVYAIEEWGWLIFEK
ncbi:MAG TPA: alpha-amylase family glycosyl hydrolase [Chitinophagaceae bacterium]|nr:alpha-amylase family glycosyl hydrolase [Chitinophagaceae bacterium]